MPRLLTLLLLVTSGCSEGRPFVLTVATDLPQALTDEVEATIEAEDSTLDVRFLLVSSDSALSLLQSGDAGFDAWWGGSAPMLERARILDLLSPHRSPWREGTGAEDDDAWQPLLLTPYVIAFNREELTLGRAPGDWLDLFHFRWVDELEVPDPTRTEAGAWFVASAVAHFGEPDDPDRGFDWLHRVDRQVDVYAPGTTAALGALGSGDARLAVLPRAVVDSARAAGDDWLYYRIPETGTPVQVRGVAVVRGTQSGELARAFVDRLGVHDIASRTTAVTGWLPAFGGIDPELIPADRITGNWIPWAVSVEEVSRLVEPSVSRWEAEVRGR